MDTAYVQEVSPPPKLAVNKVQFQPSNLGISELLCAISDSKIPPD